MYFRNLKEMKERSENVDPPGIVVSSWLGPRGSENREIGGLTYIVQDSDGGAGEVVGELMSL